MKKQWAVGSERVAALPQHIAVSLWLTLQRTMRNRRLRLLTTLFGNDLHGIAEA